MVKTDIYYLREIAENTEGGGGGGGRPYDDTELRNRIIALENGKQDSLSAGSRITISSNTINTVDFIVDSINSATTTWSSNKLQSLFEALSGKIEVEIVETKPVTPVNNTMYYVGSTAPYDIWFYVNDEYTYFGTTDIDLSDYYTETEVDALLDDKVDKVTGKSLVLDTDITQITTNKTDIAELKEEKQDKITDSTLSTVDGDTKVSEVSATSKTSKSFTLTTLWTFIKGKITEVYYPVGSVVFNMGTNPSTNFGGTWELLATGTKALYLDSTAGTSVSEELPNIKGSLGVNFKTHQSSSSSNGALSYTYKGLDVATSGSGGPYGTISFNASDSNSVYKDDGKVRAEGITVCAWKRTA